ncbi:MAG: DUF1553 domain-containing protein [Pedosphaera sp.]|nr:DUF1553 domain-containing protein [Pedosphaera sp.]
MAADADSVRAGQDFFENKIRPVLAQRCYKCHGAEKQKGKLRLDQRESLLRGGQSGRVVLPGDPSGSLLIRAIRRIDKDVQMPPDDVDQLTAEEVQNFVAWVKMGAPFPGAGSGDAPVKPPIDLAKARQFWSLKPIQKHTPPKIEAKSGARNPIDQFVLAKLQAARMKPSPSADKPALLRRATYDLTGLPPAPEEMDAFLADTSPNAFTKAVDRLLASPQYGVHWARHWFDVARYGDTRWVGAGEDRRWPFAYTYRDWVINALNADLPYDRFVTLQLAADQTPDARPADQAALGFLTLGRWFTGNLTDVIDDQIDVVTRGLLGVSVQCARCHDHKFDPISTQDYYSLYGMFAAARMPVDGSGLLADLPEVAPRPVNAAMEKEIAALRAQIDEFLRTRAAALRDEFRAPAKMQQYLLAAESLLEKKDEEVRAFAKAQSFDERILQRWVRHLKNTARNPHAIFAPWHALAAIPEAEFAARAAGEIEKVKAGKLNSHVVKLLTPVPKSLTELAQRYIGLLTKFDAPEPVIDYEQEAIRQVLRNSDSPIQISLNELGQFLTADEMKRLAEMRRTFLAKQAALSEQADQFLNYQHEAAPVLAEITEFLQQRRAAVTEEMRSPEKIASYLLTAREAETTPDGKFKSLAKSKQLSERLLRRWMDFLQQQSQLNDPVFAAWRIFAAVNEKDFASQTAQLTEQLKKTAGNAAVATVFATPPMSLAEVAKRYAELIVRCNQPKPFADVAQETIRQLLAADTSPLHRAPDDFFDYFTQKDNDGLRGKERNLMRLYLESPGAPPRAMVLRDSSRSYAQRVFVRGNPNILGEPSHGGFLTVLSPETSRPFTHGRGRRELAQAIVDPRNPLAARVIVNRVWQWHFGAGLVNTPSDFGTRGTAPTHPELLDWLSQQFMAEGWSLKKLHRQILLSSTWQQSSQDNPAARAADPENRLLWRMNRQRLSFEELRDSLLTAAGRLDTTIGGPPSDLTKNTVRRRTVFGAVDRMTLPGFYRYFDFPGADAHVPERHETIVAQQALYLMNNSFVMDQASHAARRTAAVTNSNPAARLDQLYRLILGRSPKPAERTLGLEFIQSQSAETSATNAPVLPTDAWRYGWGSYTETKQRVTEFQPFPLFANNQWKGGTQEIDPELGRANLNSHGGFAGINSDIAVIRRWIAPRGGKISISGIVSAQANSAQPTGDGVCARIVSSRHGKLGDWIAQGTEEATNLKDVAVEPGDTIDFVVDARGRDNHAGFTWPLILRMETASAVANEKLVWDAAKDFKAPAAAPAPTFDAWERLAQVLLESNEFMFRD